MSAHYPHASRPPGAHAQTSGIGISGRNTRRHDQGTPDLRKMREQNRNNTPLCRTSGHPNLGMNQIQGRSLSNSLPESLPLALASGAVGSTQIATTGDYEMKKVLALTTAFAALALAASTANADYFIRDEGGQKFVVNTDTNAETVLLIEENGAAPANCAAGSFYQTADGRIFACDDAAATFTLVAPQPGVLMPSGDPWPENAMLMVPGDVPQESGEQKDSTSTIEATTDPQADQKTENQGEGAN